MPARTLVVIAACTIVASCARDAPKAEGPAPGAASEVASLRIDPPSAAASATLGAPAATMAFRAFATRAGGAETDVTAQATWVTDGPHVADVTGPGNLVTVGIGGHAKVTATFGGASAAATLAVKLGGELSVDGAEAASFHPGSASPTVTEYPPDGVVVPANLPPLVLQWDADADAGVGAGTGAGGATTARVHLTSGDVVDVMAYATTAELTLSSDAWTAIGASAPDAPITWAVEASGSSAPSAPRTMTITAERIGQGILYAHDCKNGGLVVLDMLAATQSPLATSSQANAPAEQRIGHCAGCHDVARDGRRAGFAKMESMEESGMLFGSLRYDPAANLFAEAIAPAQIDARSAAFNPLESTTHSAMLAAYSIADPDTASLALLDPDTGLALASDISSMFGAVPAAAGARASTPAWSSHGDEIAFAAWPKDANPASQPQAPANSTLVASSVAYDATAGSFHFGPPKVLVAAANGESNVRPSYDDDDVAIAFMRTSPALGSVFLYRRADGQLLPLAAGAADPAGAWDTRLPYWGAASGPKYTWIVVASARPYGHLISPAQSQLWAFAIDRQKLASGTADPSAPAFWLPGQHTDQSYTHPQWPRAMLAR